MLPLYRVENDKVRCTACYRYCLLSNNQTGFCGVRTNRNNKLVLDVYNMPYSFNIDPIEKKPVLHMDPGARILSFGTAGCNFACRYCQNYDMSQRKTVVGSYFSPEDVIELALRYNVDGIAYTYNEPTVFMEYAHDIGILARNKGLLNIFVTNGYETEESMVYASEFLDAMTIDFKGNANNNFYNKYISVLTADKIYENFYRAKKYNIHVEITDLVIPEIGDNLEDARKMILKVKDILGEYTPISFLRYYPAYKLKIPPTPFETLKKHYDLARDLGMKYVYIGNVPEEDYENTYCPECNALLIRRNSFKSKIINLDNNGKCKKCGFNTDIKLKKKIINYHT